MVHDGADTLPARRTAVHSRHRKGTKVSRTKKGSVDDHSPAGDKPADHEALRKARLEYLGTPAAERTKKRRYVGESVLRIPTKKVEAQHKRTTPVSKRRRRATEQGSPRRRSKVRPTDSRASEYQSVYDQGRDRSDAQPRRAKAAREERYRGKEGDSQSEASSTGTLARKRIHSQPRRQSTRGVTKGQQPRTRRRRQSEPVERTQHPRHNSHGLEECPPIPTAKNTTDRRRQHDSPPSLLRSATTTRLRSDTLPTAKAGELQSKMAPSVAESHVKKASSIFSSLLRSSTTTQAASLKKVTCLTCGSDDVPLIKTAKLACTHRMCHDCLRRIFTMSVSDPAHMPPKCCTSDHIPLKHVDNLFDQKFKRTWNRKFQEYSTRNRIYCPTRHCGQWIKPNHISVENGRKVAKCKRCGTRVCCTCNHKMHTSRECPRDPATTMFIEVAKQEGWKRCFNCSAMVELKEGCNHMTCRCTAEFCMVCGCKWKTCDCPWFNYQAVEADRLEHMNVVQREAVVNAEDRRAPIRRQEQVDRRRRQERRDEDLARHLQTLGINDDAAAENRDENQDLGQVFGIGNAADHFLNDHFRHQARNILTGNFRQATQAADGLVMGALSGRENPLPPAPMELANPAGTAAIQTEQLLRRDTTASTTPRQIGSWRRRLAAQGGGSSSANNAAANGAMVDDRSGQAAAQPMPWQDAALPRRGLSVHQTRGAAFLAGMFPPDHGGPPQPAAAMGAGQQRIEAWRNEVPVGHPTEDMPARVLA